jgi:hypothetical protein
MLIADPPVPCADISGKLGLPVESIGPTQGRCLQRLRRYPAGATLGGAGTMTAGGDVSGQPAMGR